MKNAVLQLTKQLMSIHSTSDQSKELDNVLHVVKKELQNHYIIEEFEHEGIKSLLIQNTPIPSRQFKIILNAHLDIVPASKKQNKPIEKDGKLYGRGSYDMKAAAAVMIVLFKKLAKKVSYPLALQITTDEETGGKSTAWQIKQGVRADFVITGECGSDMKIVTETKGLLWLKLHTEGKPAHGAYLWRGENALTKLYRVLDKLHTLFPIPKSEAWITTMNIANILTSNTAFNHVPEDATAHLDVRFIPEDEKTLFGKIKKIVEPDATMEVVLYDPPEYVSPENKFVQLLKTHTQEIIKESRLTKLHAPSDIRHYIPVNCVGVQFGPVGSHQHADDEWVDIKSLMDYSKILHRFLIDAEKITI